MRVLVAEDDADLARQIIRVLEAEAFVADHAADGAAALEMGCETPYAAIILDPGLPMLDGFTVLRRWRDRGVTAPVIVLTASRTDVADMREGVRAGATNYLLKPLDLGLLIEWVRGVVNSGGPNTASSLLTWGRLRMDTHALRVWCDDAPVRLTPTEYRILHCLMVGAGKPIQAAQIVERAFDGAAAKTTNEIPVYISRLRDKLGRSVIETVHGYGYRLADGKKT